jgi:hypothetical protein
MGHCKCGTNVTPRRKHGKTWPARAAGKRRGWWPFSRLVKREMDSFSYPDYPDLFDRLGRLLLPTRINVHQSMLLQ